MPIIKTRKLQSAIEIQRSKYKPMSFITIHFGDDQKLLFNLLCPSVILYENIKLRCGCEQEAVVDIADENGTLKCIHGRPPDQFASEYLQGRANYVLLKVLKKMDSSTGKEISTFEPLLNNLSEIYPDLMSRVHSNKINPGLGLPIQSSTQTTTQKSTAQTRTKSRATKPRSPTRGSIGGSSLLGMIKTKSPVKVPK